LQSSVTDLTGGAQRHPSIAARNGDGFRGACHRARIRATRWLYPSYEVCNFCRGARHREPGQRAAQSSTVAALRQSRPFRHGPVVLRFANRPRPPLLSAQFAFPGVAGTRPAQKSTATEGLRIYRSIRVRGVQKNGVHRCWHEPCIG